MPRPRPGSAEADGGCGAARQGQQREQQAGGAHRRVLGPQSGPPAGAEAIRPRRVRNLRWPPRSIPPSNDTARGLRATHFGIEEELPCRRPVSRLALRSSRRSCSSPAAAPTAASTAPATTSPSRSEEPRVSPCSGCWPRTTATGWLRSPEGCAPAPGPSATRCATRTAPFPMPSAPATTSGSGDSSSTMTSTSRPRPSRSRRRRFRCRRETPSSTRRARGSPPSASTARSGTRRPARVRPTRASR